MRRANPRCWTDNSPNTQTRRGPRKQRLVNVAHLSSLERPALNPTARTRLAYMMDRKIGSATFRVLAPLLWLLILALALPGCDSGTARSSGSEVRDSAGVRIVVNTGPRWPEVRGWRLAAEPAVDIGVLQGDTNYQLFRVEGAVRLNDGPIVVANAGTSELRFYDAAGRFLSAVGREGGGPGEFGDLGSLMLLHGDSLLVWDWGHQRLSVFGPGGDFIRLFTLQSLADAGAFPTYIAPLADGSLLVAAQRSVASREIKSGVSRDSALYGRWDLQGALIDTIGRFPAGEYYTRAWDRGMSRLALPFGRFAWAAVHRAGFYFGSSDAYEIGYYTATGTLQRLIRIDQPNREVTTEDRERYKHELLEEAAEEGYRQTAERLLRDMPFPQRMPAHGALRVDVEGDLWVAGYARPGEDQVHWTVFDPDGVMLGGVETPRRFHVYQIGTDFVLGRFDDELDIEHVRLYELIKG